MAKDKIRTAVVGCGMAGLTAASQLVEAGHQVVCFDKAKGVGGRMSVRRQEGFEFDHGAQYFTARDARFVEQVRAWINSGVVAEWNARIVNLSIQGCSAREPQTRYVGVPGMHGPIKQLAEAIEVRTSTLVASAQLLSNQWQLTSDNGADLGRFDQLIVNLPPVQARALLHDQAELLAAMKNAVMEPCWAVMVGFDETVTTDFDAAFVSDSPLSWIARNSSKPQRSQKQAWVLHASPAWSTAHLEMDSEAVAQHLFDAFCTLTKTTLRPAYLSAHRWRYARAESPLDDGTLCDAKNNIAICGDWCAGGRIESAFLSGLAAVEALP
jgi:predicted NAD/FAD-dependent oxidoreductase